MTHERNRELDELLTKLDMQDYLDHEGIDYRHRMGSSGDQLNLKTCPSCGRSQWKVYMNAETGLGNCFSGGCELGTFNKWSFVKAHLGAPANVEVIQHLKTVAGVLGWRPKRISRYAEKKRGDLLLPTSIELPDINGDVLPYLLMRGVDADLCRYFQLSYCHSGCFTWEEGGQRKYQDYSERVIIPVFDMQGNLASFQGRDITGKKEPKYLFPTGFAATGSLLYNGHNAWNIKRLVVGEGVFDVIAIKAALDAEMELRDVVPVGTFGMHLASDQIDRFIELKREGLEEVTIMWDGEKPAIKAALDAAIKLRSIGVSARVALLPNGKDPNEVSPAKVREAFYGSTPADGSAIKRILARMM